MMESFVENMIKEASFPIFSDSSQMMLKLGRNIQWVEISWNLIRKYDVIIVILMSQQLKKRKVFIVSLFLDGLR